MWISTQVRRLLAGVPPMRYVLWGHGVKDDLGEEVRRFGEIVDKSGQVRNTWSRDT